MNCYLHYRREYRDGLVSEGKSLDPHNNPRDAFNEHASQLKESGIPYTADGLTLTYDDTKGSWEDMWSTATLTWTERPDRGEAR